MSLRAKYFDAGEDWDETAIVHTGDLWFMRSQPEWSSERQTKSNGYYGTMRMNFWIIYSIILYGESNKRWKCKSIKSLNKNFVKWMTKKFKVTRSNDVLNIFQVCYWPTNVERYFDVLDDYFGCDKLLHILFCSSADRYLEYCGVRIQPDSVQRKN